MSERRLFKNIISLSFAEFASRGIAFFSNAYLARSLEVEGYGVLNNINAILAYLLMAVSLGMYAIGLRESAIDKNNIQKYFSNITTIKLIAASLCFIFVIVYVLSTDVDYLLGVALLIGGIQLFAYAILVDWVFLSQEKMHIIAVRQVILSGCTFIGVVIFVNSAKDIPLYILIVSLSTLLNNIWLLKLGSKQFFKLKLQFDIPLIKSILKRAIPLSFYYFLVTFMSTFGLIYLFSSCGDYKTGLFSAAIKIASFAVIPTFIIQGAFAPSISRCQQLSERQAIAKKYSTIVFSIGAIISAMLFFFPEICIYICHGEKFVNATILLRIISLYTMFYYIANPIVTFFFYWNMEKKLLLGYTIGSTTYVIATTFLVNYYQEVGATIAMLFGDGMVAVILTIFLYTVLKKIYIHIAIPLVAVAMLSCGIAKLLIIYIFNNVIELQIIGIVVAFALFIVTTLKFGIISKDDLLKLIKK